MAVMGGIAGRSVMRMSLQEILKTQAPPNKVPNFGVSPNSNKNCLKSREFLEYLRNPPNVIKWTQIYHSSFVGNKVLRVIPKSHCCVLLIQLTFQGFSFSNMLQSQKQNTEDS